MDYLEQVVRARLALHFGPDEGAEVPQGLPHPPSNNGVGGLGTFLDRTQPSVEERVLLLLALAPHVEPDLLDRVIAEALPGGGDFRQFGGVRGQNHRGVLPTGQTAQFLLGGHDLELRCAVRRLLSDEGELVRRQVLRLDAPPPGEPTMSGRLLLEQDYVDEFTLGHATRPRLSVGFPAQRITTLMSWNDLVLPDATMAQIRELETWVRHGETLLFGEWAMACKFKEGYRALFHGPPGTGKTLTATLLGASTGRDVYRIDLSMVVSKFIGETEKNLSSLFDKAETKDWILFFDEADALFGKRTNVRDAHDRYANQEVAYLLQRVEGYRGLVILASNFKNNIDDAFMRRFQASVHFPMPTVNERVRIWNLGLPSIATLEPGVDFDALARRHELTAAHIMNVIQFACLRAIERKSHEIRAVDLELGVQREISKDGKVG